MEQASAPKCQALQETQPETQPDTQPEMQPEIVKIRVFTLLSALTL